MSFRLWTVFYVFALVAAALATFGALGIFVGAAVLAFWAIVRYGLTRTQTIVAIIFVLMLLALLLPAGRRAQAVASRTECMNLLRELARGIFSYESVKGTLPPAFATSVNAKPLFSWRVSTLFFVEPHLTLWERFDFSKAWDSPTNRTFAGKKADFFAVVDPQTAWSTSVGRPLSEIKDDASKTILIIESHALNVNWAEPRDLTFDEAVELLSTPASAEDGHPVEDGFFYKRRFGRCVAFADGHAEFIPGPMSRELAAALLTVDGGEDLSQLNLAAVSRPELDYAKCYGFGLFVLLAVMPVCWARRRSPEGAHSDSPGRSPG
jgi:hypothetical protein